MAYTDKTRYGEMAQKKVSSVFAAELSFGTADENVALATGHYLVAKLPPEAVITNAYVHVVTASDAATSAVATLGTAEAGTQILSAANLKTAGKQGTFTGQSLTTTGVDVYLGITLTGAATVGKFLVVIEYLEYSKNTGEYTQISRFA